LTPGAARFRPSKTTRSGRVTLAAWASDEPYQTSSPSASTRAGRSTWMCWGSRSAWRWTG
jgi:hypothetical protein